MTWDTWPNTQALLEQLTSEELHEAAEQARQYCPITNLAIKELLKAITWVGSSSTSSNEKKSHMLVELRENLKNTHQFSTRYFEKYPPSHATRLTIAPFCSITSTTLRYAISHVITYQYVPPS
jgi:hypothetical protein